MKTPLVALIAALALTSTAQAQDKKPEASGPTPGPHSGESASIPFARFGNIWDWEAAPDGNGIYLQDNSRNWYFASLMGPCTNLPFATRIGIQNWGFDSVDDSSTIVVDRDRCAIAHLVHSGPPPKKPRR